MERVFLSFKGNRQIRMNFNTLLTLYSTNSQCEIFRRNAPFAHSCHLKVRRTETAATFVDWSKAMSKLPGFGTFRLRHEREMATQPVIAMSLRFHNRSRCRDFPHRREFPPGSAQGEGHCRVPVGFRRPGSPHADLLLLCDYYSATRV